MSNRFVALLRIEQELLARVVSDMVPPVPDPTARMRRSGSSQSFADSSDTEPTGKLQMLCLLSNK